MDEALNKSPSLPIPTPVLGEVPRLGRQLPARDQNMEHPQPSWVFHSLSGEATYKGTYLPALLGQTNH
jgi:hypothetical protein